MDQAPLGAEGASDPVEGGEVDVATEQSEGGEQEAPPRQYVEVDDPDNRFVRVKIDGEDHEVPFSEAVRGYSRTEDYTRKTQEAARMREEAQAGLRIQQALDANPALTLQILAEQYGQQIGYQAPPPQEEEQQYADPLEKALNEERQARQALEYRITAREADQALNEAIGGLRGTYQASDDDVREVVGVAYRLGLGIEALPMIYESMAFQKINARVQAMHAQERQKQAEEARRTAAKTTAGQVISSGSSANGLTTQIDPNGSMSIRQAIEAAFNQFEG